MTIPETPTPPKPPEWKANAAECVTTMVPPPGANIADPTQMPNRWVRSADGKMRFDFPNSSVIHDPPNLRTITLDHLTKEFHVTPFDPKSKIPGMPGMPGMPQAPAMPEHAMQAIDLGKALIEGHEVTGKRYTFPQPSGMPIISEVWTSTSHQMPVLTKTMGPFGEHISHCRYSNPQPPSATFEPPHDYKQIHPPAVPSVAAPSVTVPTI